MMFRNFLTALILLCLLGAAVPQTSRPQATPEHEYYLSYRTCFATMIGLDWIQDALNKIIEHSVSNF